MPKAPIKIETDSLLQVMLVMLRKLPDEMRRTLWSVRDLYNYFATHAKELTLDEFFTRHSANAIKEEHLNSYISECLLNQNMMPARIKWLEANGILEKKGKEGRAFVYIVMDEIDNVAIPLLDEGHITVQS